MKMKKLLGLALVVVCTCSFVACGNSKKESKSEGTEGVAISKVEDLEGKKIGVQLGTTGDVYTSEDFGDENVERYSKGFEAVQALTQGKIDAVVIDDQPAKAFVEANKGLKILEAAYAEEEYAMCFKKGNEELIKKINVAIGELKKEGVFDSIVTYYLSEGEGAKRYESSAEIDRSNGKLIMATNAEFPPYEFYEGEEVVGIDADFARAIADKLGMELKIEDMAFDAIIPAIQGGKADFGAAGLTVNEERKTQVDFADSYYTGRQVIIVKE